MFRSRLGAPLLAAALFLTADIGYLAAQTPNAGAATAQVRISYDPPTDPRYQPIYEGLKKRQVLERLQGFLAPLRLPRELRVRVAQCGADTMPYKSGEPVTICYEIVRRVSEIASEKSKDPKEQELIRYGTFVELVLHQVAYAVFDQLQIPVWGRADDAADRLAALTMMQFGDKVAFTTIIGTARFFQLSNHAWTGTDFSAETSPEAQRFYNYLCIAYGGDPITFSFLRPHIGSSKLPTLTTHRAERCAEEYLQVRHAFDLRIMPFVDPDLVIKVRASQWLNADEVPGTAQ